MKSDSPYDTIDWLGLRLEVPHSWQIVRHGTKKNLGTLAFTDRYCERLNLTWRKLEREPDVERLVSDQLARDQAQNPNFTLSRLRLPGWHAYRAETGDSTWLRAVRYEAKSSQLLEVWLSLRPAHKKCGRVSESLVSAIRGIEPLEETAKLQAFDVATEYPATLDLSKTTIEPASATFEFEQGPDAGHRSKKATARVRRMAMADSWYGGNAFRLLSRESGHVDFQKHEERAVGAHVMTYAEGDTTKGLLKRWLGRSQRCRALLWHCAQENAVYHVATESYDTAPLYPEQFAVLCCKTPRVETREP